MKDGDRAILGDSDHDRVVMLRTESKRRVVSRASRSILSLSHAWSIEQAAEGVQSPLSVELQRAIDSRHGRSEALICVGCEIERALQVMSREITRKISKVDQQGATVALLACHCDDVLHGYRQRLARDAAPFDGLAHSTEIRRTPEGRVAAIAEAANQFLPEVQVALAIFELGTDHGWHASVGHTHDSPSLGDDGGIIDTADLQQLGDMLRRLKTRALSGGDGDPELFQMQFLLGHKGEPPRRPGALLVRAGYLEDRV